MPKTNYIIFGVNSFYIHDLQNIPLTIKLPEYLINEL